MCVGGCGGTHRCALSHGNSEGTARVRSPPPLASDDPSIQERCGQGTAPSLPRGRGSRVAAAYQVTVATFPQRETQVRRHQVTAPALPPPPAAARPLLPGRPRRPRGPRLPLRWSLQGPRCPAGRDEMSGGRPHSAGGCGSAGSPGAARLAAQEPLHCDAARAAGQWARGGANR